LKKQPEEQLTRPYLVRLVSLGCPKNTVDTGVAAGALLVDGFGLTADDDEADVMWINTCAFLLSARKEAIEEIRRACAWKKRRAGRLVVVAGCLPQWDKDGSVRAKYPQVDIQACSSGGGHLDYGFLRYADECWASDDSDARERVFIVSTIREGPYPGCPGWFFIAAAPPKPPFSAASPGGGAR
jgi:hypothetical protein